MDQNHHSLRSIRIVIESAPSGPGRLELVDPLLDRMGAAELALARTRYYVCGHCGAPVRIRVRAIAASKTTGGKRAHFLHHCGAGHECPSRAGCARSVAEVQANRFNGQQEGERHDALKHSLAAALASVEPFLGADCEIAMCGIDGDFKRPDVLAISRHGTLAIDVQLSPPLIDTITARNRFYARNAITHCWIIDGFAPQEVLQKQGFIDLAAQTGGRVLGWDEACEAQTRQTGQICMRLITMIDHSDRIDVMTNMVVGDDLLSLIGLHARPPLLANDLFALAAWDSISARNPRRLVDLINSRSLFADHVSPSELTMSGILPLLGAVLTLHRGVVSDGSNHQPDAIGAVINCALGLEYRDRRFRWAHLLQIALSLPELSTHRLGPRTPEVLRRALARSDEVECHALSRRWAPLLHRLMPGLMKLTIPLEFPRTPTPKGPKC